MFAHVRRVESASTYFTRRAGQERANAAAATSPDTRRAHLELAVRLVKVATEPALWGAWTGNLLGRSASRQQADDGPSTVGKSLSGAFPLRLGGKFQGLLKALDETHR